MMLKVFPDDDLRSTAHDRQKELEKGIHMTTTMIPSISMLALPECVNLLVRGADTSRVGINITLMQDGRLLIHTKASATLHTRFLKGKLIATKFKIWLDTEDNSRLMDLQLGGRRWIKATSKAIVGIAWKIEVAEMATGQ
ncbi:hypothetical protein B296_00004754 [Ensete ventricosum]|uniref:Uncharacterized protein n=1 Tax=Ensete ventricosum TaxID=4639 RepID=A0A426X175_ENSVE|nr:hypothetical protein B296_00004754 [Ensete ventricosum]